MSPSLSPLGAEDRELLQRARRERRTLLTRDTRLEDLHFGRGVDDWLGYSDANAEATLNSAAPVLQGLDKDRFVVDTVLQAAFEVAKFLPWNRFHGGERGPRRSGEAPALAVAETRVGALLVHRRQLAPAPLGAVQRLEPRARRVVDEKDLPFESWPAFRLQNEVTNFKGLP